MLCTFWGRTERRCAEFAPVDLTGLRHPVDVGGVQCHVDRRCLDPLLAKFRTNTDRPLSALSVMMNEARDEPIVADQALGLELRKHRFN